MLPCPLLNCFLMCMYHEFLDTRDVQIELLDPENATFPRRLDEPLGGSGSLKVLIAYSVLHGEAVGVWQKASEDCLNRNLPVDWNIDFDDVKFGCSGKDEVLELVFNRLPGFLDEVR